MMAHNSTPGPAALAAETTDAVRAALAEFISAPSQSNALRDALRHLAVEARERSMLPEQLLIALKDIWYALPSVQRISEPASQVRLLQRVVTMCIQEYYAD